MRFITAVLHFVTAFATVFGTTSTIAFAAAEISETQIKSAEKACETYSKTKPVVVDMPTSAELETLKSCDSEAAYYGIGREIDFVLARKCAYAEIARDESESPLGGAALLFQIYGNGQGIKKNFALARKFACVNGSGEVLVTRLNAIADAEKGKPIAFEYCQGAYTTPEMNACASMNSRVATAAHKKKLAAIAAKFTPEQKKVFETLTAAATTFAQARSSNEIDLSGTMRTMLSIGERDIQNVDFLESLNKFEAGQDNRYDSARLKKEDERLNKLYRKAMATKAFEDLGITKEGLKETQKAWLKYRDSWVAFAKLRYPKVPSESVTAWFTVKRNHMYDSLLEFAKDL